MLLERAACPRCDCPDVRISEEPVPWFFHEFRRSGEWRFRWRAVCDVCGWHGRPADAIGHALSIAAWAGFLARHWPTDYSDRSPSTYPTPCLPGTAGKIDVLAGREDRRLGLYHPIDGDEAGCDDLAREADPGRNGRVLHGTGLQILTSGLDCDEGESEEGAAGEPALAPSIEAWAARGVRVGGPEPRCECGWGYWEQSPAGPVCRWCGRAKAGRGRQAA